MQFIKCCSYSTLICCFVFYVYPSIRIIVPYLQNKYNQPTAVYIRLISLWISYSNKTKLRRLCRSFFRVLFFFSLQQLGIAFQLHFSATASNGWWYPLFIIERKRKSFHHWNTNPRVKHSRSYHRDDKWKSFLIDKVIEELYSFYRLQKNALL